MKNKLYPKPPNFWVKTILLVSVFLFSMGFGSGSVVSAGTSLDQQACGQMLADAEARFLSTLAADGSVPASPETQAAAQEYIRVSKLCYEEIEAQGSTAQGENPEFIDEGGLLLEDTSSAGFVFPGNKWGTAQAGSSGGTVTYSFMGTGISFAAENAGSSVAFSSLPGFQACFITEIQNAFAAWQAVANIQFVQVNDNGAAFNANGASGDIRIGAHHFDGPSGTLAHAYYPPPNGATAAGDMHFDSSEYWTCNTSGMDIGIVALHEIGHSLGLAHENTSNITVMDPYYNTSLISLQSDDINGASTIYGPPAQLSAPPPNDNMGSATVIGIPYSETLDTSGATPGTINNPGQLNCGGNVINQGTMNVWYRFTAATTMNVSFDTFGSTTPSGGIYDTYIAVWTSGSSLVACNDDTANTLQSQLVVNLTPGTYFIEVAQYNGDSDDNTLTGTGGTLRFRALASGGADTAGVFRPSNGLLYLKNTNTSGFADVAINYGIPGDYPVTGDWDGNGTDTIGVYRNGTFYLRNSNTVGFADIVFPFGQAGDQPIA
ncbi:MAG TPA: matrixin family metalloprotease, partial [Anaerolineales bacterium]|nr:matrixin family metalloprotease [Anaerolineales bacterium]